MLEARRRAYLKSMGVVQYTPVNAIDGAKVSPILQLDDVYPAYVDEEPSNVGDAVLDTVTDVAVDTAVDTAVDSVAVGYAPDTPIQNTNLEIANAQPPVQQQSQQQTKQQPPSPIALSENPPVTPDIKITPLDDSAVVSESTAASVEQPLRFALTMVEFPGKLLVLADLGSADAMGCSALEYQLLQAILKSLTLSGEPSPHLFRWPMVNNTRIVQGKAEAAEGLQGFLGAKLEKQPVPNLLLVGENASSFMPAQTGQTTIEFVGQSVQCFRTPSLLLMLQDWQHKPLAWKVLSGLKSTLG
ncbi:MAG: hypothetical protein COA99_15910 [Moraxellaceae bacterium]|nr:MAG: hypothetical protein COA99_15910 [Moraxellaceae bacterium]